MKKILKAGDEVLKNSKIDLILGDGKISFEEEETEEIIQPTDINIEEEAE